MLLRQIRFLLQRVTVRQVTVVLPGPALFFFFTCFSLKIGCYIGNEMCDTSSLSSEKQDL